LICIPLFILSEFHGLPRGPHSPSGRLHISPPAVPVGKSDPQNRPSFRSSQADLWHRAGNQYSCRELLQRETVRRSFGHGEDLPPGGDRFPARGGFNRDPLVAPRSALPEPESRHCSLSCCSIPGANHRHNLSFFRLSYLKCPI